MATLPKTEEDASRSGVQEINVRSTAREWTASLWKTSGSKKWAAAKEMYHDWVDYLRTEFNKKMPGCSCGVCGSIFHCEDLQKHFPHDFGMPKIVKNKLVAGMSLPKAKSARSRQETRKHDAAATIHSHPLREFLPASELLSLSQCLIQCHGCNIVVHSGCYGVPPRVVRLWARNKLASILKQGKAPDLSEVSTLLAEAEADDAPPADLHALLSPTEDSKTASTEELAFQGVWYCDCCGPAAAQSHPLNSKELACKLCGLSSASLPAKTGIPLAWTSLGPRGFVHTCCLLLHGGLPSNPTNIPSASSVPSLSWPTRLRAPHTEWYAMQIAEPSSSGKCLVCNSGSPGQLLRCTKTESTKEDPEAFIHASCAVRYRLFKEHLENDIATESTSDFHGLHGTTGIYPPNSEPVPVYCHCRQPDDGFTMIQCDSCKEWFHESCCQVDGKAIEDSDTYVCDVCGKFHAQLSIIACSVDTDITPQRF